MKRAFTVLLILLVIGGAYWWYAHNKAVKAKAAAVAPKQEKVTRGNITKFVAASGNVSSNLDVDIKCKASGTIITLPYDIGASVVKDELLVELDPVDEQRNVDLAQINLDQSQARYQKAKETLASSERDLVTSRQQAQIDLENAKAQADQAQVKVDYTNKLFAQGYASQDDVNVAATALASSKANLDSAQQKFKVLDNQEADLELQRKDVAMAQADTKSAAINLQVANDRLGYTKVYAPMNGFVTARAVQVGQIISSGISTTTGGTSIMTLSDMSHIYVDAAVDQSDIGPVDRGQEATVTVDSFPNEKFKGSVVRMAKSGNNVSNVVTFQVRIEITSENKGLLMPQMTADANIIVASKKDVLLVPDGAVTKDHGKSTVQVVGPDGKPETRDVEVGISDGTNYEIVSGLTENDTVIVKDLFASTQFSRSNNQQRGPGGPPGAFMGGGGGGRGR